MTVHSKLGASSSERWMHCTASVAFIAEGGEKKDVTIYNVGGHLAHDVAARCLADGSDAWEHVGDTVTEEDVTCTFGPDDAIAVQTYLDTLRKRKPFKRLIEVGFHCPEIHEQFFGTSDDVDIMPIEDNALDIWDYKHGAGLPVEVKNNSQLKMYAVGAIKYIEKMGLTVPRHVRLWICQPRAFHPSGPVRMWQTTSEELMRWIDEEWLPKAAETADPERARFEAGDHCRFCPRRLDCPLLHLMKDNILALTEAEIKMMTDAELGRLNDELVYVGFMRKAAADETFARLMKGDQVPGSKLVNAKTDRIWKDKAEEELKEAFGDELYDRKIKSPSQVEKMPGGSTLVKKLAYKPEGRLTVANVNDVRSGRSAKTAAEVFGLTKAK